jgi:hypothetical protein
MPLFNGALPRAASPGSPAGRQAWEGLVNISGGGPAAGWRRPGGPAPPRRVVDSDGGRVTGQCLKPQ